MKRVARSGKVKVAKTALAGIMDRIAFGTADAVRIRLRPPFPIPKRKIPVFDRSNTGIVLASPRGFEPRYSP